MVLGPQQKKKCKGQFTAKGWRRQESVKGSVVPLSQIHTLKSWLHYIRMSLHLETESFER